MFDRLRRAIVESYVGAIALGYLLAQAILHFVNVFASPVASWISRNEYRGLMPERYSSTGLLYRDAVPELGRFVFLLLLWYVVFRWLYYRRAEAAETDSTAAPGQPTPL